MLNPDDLAGQLRDLGVKPGAVLLVHSGLRRVGPVRGEVAGVLEALRTAVGDEGTVIVPTHTWATVTRKQPVFDVRHTPSHVGRLTEHLRSQPEAVRSLHPTHSIAAIGTDAEAIVAGELNASTPCHPSGPYGRLLQHARGQVLMLGVTLRFCTVLHALEEEAGLPVLERRTTRYTVYDHAGEAHQRDHHRHAEGVDRFYEDLEPLARDAGALRVGRVGMGVSRVIDGPPFRRYALDLLGREPGVMLHVRRDAAGL